MNQQINRRSLVASTAVLGAVGVGAGLTSASDAQNAVTPRTQKQIAARATALAEELSGLLRELDDGYWEFRVRPLFEGEAIVQVQSLHSSARGRLHEGMAIISGALAELKPGIWESTLDIDAGLVRFDAKLV